MLPEGYCCAAGLAMQSDGILYAACPKADEKGWAELYAEDQKRMVNVDDDKQEEVMVYESEGIKECGEGKRPKGGLWIAGEKYFILNQQKHDVGGTEVPITTARLGKKGIVIVATVSQIVIAK